MRRGRPIRKRRPFFQSADWLWNPIPASPTLHASSSTWSTKLSATAGGAMRVALTTDYGVKMVPGTAVTAATPRYDVSFANVPAWGSDPLPSMTVPIPLSTPVPPGSDGHMAIADPLTGMIFSLWQASWSGSAWSASWGGVARMGGDGTDFSGHATGCGLSRYGAVITTAELQAAATANTGLSHALFFSTDIAAASFAYPAWKSDGINIDGFGTPLPEGARVQLDPTINIDAVSGITAAEKVVAKTLQTHGAYCGDNGGSRMAFLFEYQTSATPYEALGLEWDYFDMNHIPWTGLRVLKNWDGSA